MYNLWWPLAIIGMPESSTIVGFYALSYLVTQFDRHSCAAKFNVEQASLGSRYPCQAL